MSDDQSIPDTEPLADDLDVISTLVIQCAPDGISSPVLTFTIRNLPCGDMAVRIAEQMVPMVDDLIQAMAAAHPLCLGCPARSGEANPIPNPESDTCH